MDGIVSPDIFDTAFKILSPQEQVSSHVPCANENLLKILHRTINSADGKPERRLNF